MPKWANTDVMDGALSVVRNNATRMVARSGQPADFAAANTAPLAQVTMAPADFTLAGTVDGRRATVAAKSGVTISATGSADHIALLDVANSRLLYVTTCPAQTLTAGGGATVSFAAWDIEIGNPV